MNKNIVSTKSNLKKRFFAGLFDYSIIYTVTYLIFDIWGVPNSEGNIHVTGFPAFCIFIFWFIWTIGFEQYFGATLGNSIFNLKPISIRKNELKLSNREVNPEVSGRLRRWYCPPRRDGRVFRRLSLENPSSIDESFLIVYKFIKLLGVIVVLIPKYPLIKEWAYAGFIFVMTGAIFSDNAKKLRVRMAKGYDGFEEEKFEN